MMKWKYFPIECGDSRAKAQVIDNLTAGAHGHTLSRKLLARFEKADGPMVLIAFESLDLDYPHLYKYASYSGGMAYPVGDGQIPWTDAPRWGLVEALDAWLHTSYDAVVLCENWVATCDEATRGTADGSWESRTLCFGATEVYHVLTNDDRGKGATIEAALRESQYCWATGVCCRCAHLPRADVQSEAFFEDVVGSTRHIFVPALDEEGFLVWSPRSS
jgi:hypothetical protein